MPIWRDRLTEKNASLRQDLVKESDGFVLHTYQDVGPVLDDNQRMRSQGQKSGTHGSIAARVPEILYWVQWPEEFKKRYGWHPKRPPLNIKPRDADKLWRDFFVAKLHDRDYSKTRIDQRRFTANG